MTSRLLSETQRTARKEHQCCDCSRTIDVGEQYWYFSAADGAHIWEAKQCPQCMVLHNVIIRIERQELAVYEDEHTPFGGIRFALQEWAECEDDSYIQPGTANLLACRWMRGDVRMSELDVAEWLALVPLRYEVVARHEDRTWEVVVWCNGHRRHVGSHDTRVEANTLVEEIRNGIENRS